MSSRACVRWFSLLAVVAFLATFNLTSFAAPIASRITQAINESQTTRLAGNTRPEANRMNDRGPVSDSMDVDHIFLLLQRSPQKEKALDKLIEQLNDRKSSNFHHWLTAEEFGSRFGVAQEDIDTVTNWLSLHGFRVNQVYPNHVLIDISGTAGQIRETFGTEIHELDVNGEKHISNMSDPRVPSALMPVVKGIASLNDFKPHPMYKSAKDYTFAGCTNSTALPTEPGTCYSITPSDNATIYSLNPLFSAGISGQGQTIALVEDTDVYGGTGASGDVATYRNKFGLNTAYPAGTFTQVHPGCTDPSTNADDGEAAIDVEVATGIAPSAAIELISCSGGSVTFGGLIALTNLVNAAGPYPGIVSVSYGVCEVANGNGGNAAFYNTYQQAATQGISVFVSSGDAGPSQCSADFSAGSQYDVTSIGITGWGESPYNVSVGGTDFEDWYNSKTGQNGGAALSTYWNPTTANSSTFGSAKGYIPEMPWNDSCASTLISFLTTGSYTPYGASPATCNNATYDKSTNYLSTGAASGGASNCATGQGGTSSNSYLITDPGCQGYAKPSYQTGSSLTGGKAVYGSTNDGVRDIPDVSMFAANGTWGHYETVCWSDPAYTSVGAASCSGAPSTWSGFGGTSVASPTLAAIQALVNQNTGTTWGNPNPIYYQIAQNEYGTSGGTFLGSGCNSSTGSGSGCVFNDITQGDIDLACEYNGTTEEAHCYKPTGTHGVDSTDNVTAATMINGGSGYTTAPTCTIAGPTNSNAYKSPTGTTLFAGGTQATCTAAVTNATTTAKWTITMASTSGVGDTIILTNPAGTTTCGPYTLAGTTTTLMAAGLVTSIGSACSLASATSSAAVVTLTAKTTGYAGTFNAQFGTATEFNQFYVYMTNTTLGQGPNYVSGITIGTAGSGYQPETPITLTGGGGAGAVAVANTTIGTGAQSYQPTYGAAQGYDLATGLGSVNGFNLVCSSQWGTGSVCTTTTIASSQNPSAVGAAVTFTAAVAASSGTAAGSVQFSIDGSAFGSPVALSSGSATTSTSSLGAGTHTVTAAFTGTGFLGSSATLSGGQVVVTPGITTPANGATLTSNKQTFTWTAYPGATGYWLDLGSSAGASTYYQSGALSSSTTSVSVNSLPVDGSTVYATWYYQLNGSYVPTSYSYTAFGGVPPGDTIAVLTAPTSGSVLTSSTVAFTWSAGTGATSYLLDVGNVAGGNQYYHSGATTALSATVSGLPVNGSTVYATLYTLIAGAYQSNAYSFTAFNPGAAAAVMQSPTAGSVLPGNSATFSWSTGTGATSYWLDIGSQAGGSQYYQSGSITSTSAAVSDLPQDGSPVYVTLYTLINGAYASNAYTYTAFNTTTGLAVMQTPVPGSTLTGSSATFTWAAGSGASAYWLDVGSNAGGSQYYQSGNLGAALTATVNGLPTDGSTVYVTLYSYVDGGWLNNPYTYIAYLPAAAVISSPTPGSATTANSVTFTWNAISGATYDLDAGPAAGGNQYYHSGNITSTSTTAPNLPVDGSTFYVTLYTTVNGATTHNSYTYTGAPGAAMQSPTPGGTLSLSSPTFTWSAGTGVSQYDLQIGSTYGGSDLYDSGATTATTATASFSTPPTTGSTVYVTLYSTIGAQLVQSYYYYTVGP